MWSPERGFVYLGVKEIKVNANEKGFIFTRVRK
jgi:hypothetical protein